MSIAVSSDMTSEVLSCHQIEEFIARGWTKVEAAIPREQTAKVRDFLWDKLAERGLSRDEPVTWRNPLEFIAENYQGSPFDECATARLASAISDLIGSGRWIAERDTGWWGWWPVNFAVGADQTWDVPAEQWHIDCLDEGTYPTAPDQGLLVICLFSDLAPRGGGTLLLEGSHQIVLRLLQENPGLTQNQINRELRQATPYLRALCNRDDDDNEAPAQRIAHFMEATTTDKHGAPLRVVETSGQAGDVILGHPLLFHAPSFNHAGTPRFMCNRKTPLFEPLQLERAAGDYSPLEQSVRRVISPVL